jgi:hypothetical protein
LKKFLKIVKWFIISILLLIIALWFIVKIPAVQNWLGHKITDRLAKQLHTKVTVERISFSLFNYLNLEGLYVEDLHKDTLLYAGLAQVKITDWFFLKDRAELSYINLSNAVIHTNRQDSVWNYQFAIDAFSSKSKDSSTKKGIVLELKHAEMHNIVVTQKDAWMGETQNIRFKNLDLNANEINFSKQIIDIANLRIEQPFFSKAEYARLKPIDTTKTITDTSAVTKHWKLFGWNININELKIKDGTVQIDKQTNRTAYNYFDSKHLSFNNINADIDKLLWKSDTITLITDLTAKEKSGLQVNKFKAHIKAYPNTIEFNQFTLETPNSTVNNAIAFSFTNFTEDISAFMHSINITANLQDTKISSKDLALFAPNLANWNKDIKISGIVKGTVDNFKTQNLVLQIGTQSTLKGALSMVGLPDIKETFIDFNNGHLQTNYNDLSSFIPAIKNAKGIALPKLGSINYKGNFTGFINDFVTYGTLQTDLGLVQTDLNMKLPTGGAASYSGKIITEDFKLGSFLNNNHLGTVGFNGKIVGTGFNMNTLVATVDGVTTKLQYDNYTYQNISTKGTIQNKIFTGTIGANDPNLIATLNGIINFSGVTPVVDIKAHLDRANFKALQFLKEDYSLTGNVALNFSGNNIDNFDGSIKMDGATLKKDGRTLPFDYLTVTSTKTANGKELIVNSNEFEGFVKGRFTYNNIVTAFTTFLYQYYPSIFKQPSKIDSNQNFEFEVTTKNVEDYTKLLKQDITGLNDAHIKGSVNTLANVLEFHANVPYFGFGNYRVTKLILDGNGTIDSLAIVGNAERLSFKDSLDFYNTAIQTHTQNGQSFFTIASTSDNTLNEVNINGNIVLLGDNVQITFEPSDFTVNGAKWVLEKNGELILGKNIVTAENLKFVHNDQEIEIKNGPSGENGAYELIATVKNVEIGDFTPLFIKTNKFTGKLNGTITVDDPLGKPIISTISHVDQFWKDTDSIGRVDLTGNFNIATGKVVYTADSKNPDYKFFVDGFYNPKDSSGNTISNKIKLDGTNIRVVEPYLSSVFKDVKGTAVGELEIFGTTKRQYILGEIEIQDSLEMTVKYTNVKYVAQKGKVYFQPEVIDFSKLTLKDVLQNKAYVSRGRIYHDGFFKSMRLDVEMSSDKIMLLNTSKINNSTFYGYAVGDVKMKLKGPVDDLKMSVQVNDPADAKLVLNTTTQGKVLGKADYVEFKTYGREMNASKTTSSSNFGIDLALNANKNAEISVILDEIAGDNITARGTGLLNIGIQNSDLTIKGGYTVESGDYLFSLQSWFRKKFEIKSGSTITWSGDPYNAEININAGYIAKSISLNDLYNSLDNNVNFAPTDLLVSAKITEKLSKPLIKFNITVQDEKNSANTQVQNALDLIRKDENELIKQVAFLVLFDRLLPYGNNTKIGVEGPNLAINTISGLLAKQASNEITKLLQKQFGIQNISANIDFKTYSPSGLLAVTNGIAERAVSTLNIKKSWLDDRLTFNFSGNFDFGLLRTQSSTIQLLPNFQLEYKIRPDGSIVGTLFRREALDALQSESERNKRKSSGGGIAWRKESDDFWAILGLRKKKKK